MSYENLCMSCMKDIGTENKCPYCGFRNDSPQLPPFLPYKTVVGGRYLLGSIIEANGDGATYMAYDLERKATVTVREFLPDTLVTRSASSPVLVVKPEKEKLYASCLNGFLDMWRKLARMRGLSALILVIDIVEENNTAYAVCEHMEGAVTLRDYLLSGTTGYMSWEEARILFMPVLSTLATLHSAGIIHRGISPNTLYICPDRKIRIGGFSIPECRNVNSGIAAEIFAGYAPVEQFGVQAPSGPWTDIYAFSAVLYRSLVGSTPIESTERMHSDRMMIPAKFAEQIPAYVINALINALQIMPEDRTKTVEQFRAELTASPTDAMAADYKQRSAAERPARRAVPRAAAAGAAAAGATAAGTHKPTAPSGSGSPGKTPSSKSPGGGKKENPEDKKKDNVRLALISGGIVAAVAVLIFVILCFTVLRDHIGKTPAEQGTDTPTVSSETVEVPTFTGMTYVSISSQKSYFSDFKIETTEEFNTEVKKGYVISQSVEGGTKVPKGTAITLVVSKGTEQITMINVIGNTYEEASAKLTELGFVCERLDKVNDGTQTSGTVAAANLIVDTQYDKGTAVKLQVWKDPDTTTTTDTAAE